MTTWKEKMTSEEDQSFASYFVTPQRLCQMMLTLVHQHQHQHQHRREDITHWQLSPIL